MAVHGVTRESDLLLRWSFDEGSGSSSQNLIGTALDVILHPGATWGHESNGSAKSGFSLDLSSGTSRGSVLSDTRLQASNDFTYMFWFKSNGVPGDFSQLLSKRQGTFSSYFVQIDPGGGSLKTFFRKYGTYYDTGSIEFSPNTWHILAASHDGKKISTYLDGNLIYQTKQSDPIFVEEGDLGIGGTADGGSLFNGWIDDFRIYGKVLDHDDVQAAWANGLGDFGPSPDFSSADRSPASMPMTVNLVFRDILGNPSDVSGFDESDLSLTGATADNFTQISASSYSFELNSTKRPQRILVSIPAAAGRDDQNITTSAANMVVIYGDIVTSSEDLVGWWNFDNHVMLEDSNSDFNASWTPANLSSPPVMWLDANDSSTFEFSSGNEVSRWKSKLDPNYYFEAYANTNPERGTLINGIIGVDFNVGDRMRTRVSGRSGNNPLGPNGETITDSAVFVVYTLQSTGLSQTLFDNGANWKTQAPWNNGFLRWDAGRWQAPYRIQANNWAVKDETMVAMWYISETEDKQQVWKNGKIFIEDDSGSSYTNPNNITREFRLPQTSSGYNLNAAIGELIITKGVLAEIDRNLIHDYLLNRWDLSDRRVVLDSSGGDVPAKLVGGARIDRMNEAFGEGSLRLNGSDAWAQIGFSRTLPPKVVRQENLELWWPLDGNLTDMSGNGRNASINGQEKWADGYYDQAFSMSGDDYLFASGYKAISGTGARTLSLWHKTTSPNYMTLAYWGDNSSGKRWLLRIYRNDLQLQLNGPTRRSFTKNLHDGVWHHLAATLPEGGGDRDDIRLFIDGKEAEIYGQWGTRDNLDTGTSTDFSIGRRWDQWQKFVGEIDDVRLYSVDLSDFEIMTLYREASSGMHNLGEKSYSISVWAKPEALVPKMDYAFATGWYEVNGVEEMQAVMDQGRVNESQYYDMSVIDPKTSLQSSVFPDGLTFRAFDGDFSNTNLNEIDGPGYVFESNVAHSQMTRNLDANFSAMVAFPVTETNETDDFILWELGGTGQGAFVGFRDGHLRVRAGAGGSNVAAPGSSTATMALLDLNYSTLQSLGATDGKLHELRWEMKVGSAGNSSGWVRFWIDGVLAGESSTTGSNNALAGGVWAGANDGGFGVHGGNNICSGESTDAWPYAIGSSLLYEFGEGFKVKSGYVYEEKSDYFDSAIQYDGSTFDLATGGLTGTDLLGGVWFGKIRISNNGFLKSGEITFGTRSNEGSALWVDLDRDGDFSRSGLNGDEMVVNNLNNHNARNRVGTVFLGYKAPFAMRTASATNPGLFAGTDSFSTVYHATDEGEKLAVGTERMLPGQWNHLVMVVNREEGKLIHFLNGRLVGEDSFLADRDGEMYSNDWYIGGFPNLNKFSGWMDELRLYNIALSDLEVSKIHNWGSGDMGITGELIAPFVTDQNPIPVNLKFRQYGNEVAVSGLTIAEVNASVTGGQIDPTTFLPGEVNASSFSFSIIPDENATEINFALPEASANYFGEPTLGVNFRIKIVPDVLDKDKLLNWWWFDEAV